MLCLPVRCPDCEGEKLVREDGLDAAVWLACSCGTRVQVQLVVRQIHRGQARAAAPLPAELDARLAQALACAG